MKSFYLFETNNFHSDANTNLQIKSTATSEQLTRKWSNLRQPSLTS